MILYFVLIVRIVFILDLTILSIIDIKTKNVPVKGQLVSLVSGLTLFALSLIRTLKYSYADFGRSKILDYITLELPEPRSLIAGFVVLTIICLLIAVVTGGMGGGDVKILGAVGLNYGLISGLEILMSSLIFSGSYCVLLRILPKVNRVFFKLKNVKEIPMIPFITISSILQFV